MAKINNNFLRIQLESEMEIKLELMGFLEADPGWKGNTHDHSFWELVFLKSGRGELIYKKTKYHINAGDICLLEPHVEHCFTPEPNKVSQHLYIGFSVGGEFTLCQKNLSLPILDKKDTLPVATELNGIVSRMEHQTKQAELEKCSGDVLSILLKLLSGLIFGAKPSDEKLSRSEILIEKVKNLLGNNLKKNISVDRLANSFYLSPHYFGDLFKRHTGMTLKEYHNFLRLKKAEKMLRDPELTVSIIADELGYNSVHYFSRKFKKYYGMSPSDFRTKENS